MRILLISALVATASIQYVTSDCEMDFIPPKGSLTKLYSGEQKFSLNMLDAITKVVPNDNIFFSPYSVFHALLLAYFGAANQTQKYLENVLHLDPEIKKSQYKSIYSTRKNFYSKSDGTEFKSADRLFVDKNVALRDCIKEHFTEIIEPTDFASNADKSREMINAWVQNITKGHIKDILVEGSVTQATQIVLANAAYFKGKWAAQFDPKETEKEQFHASSGKIDYVDMMHIHGNYYHAVSESLGAHLLEMPYEGSMNMSMIIILPPTMYKLEDVLRVLTPDNLRLALLDGQTKEVDVKLPRLTFEKTLELVPILKQIGVGDLFSDASDLSDFSEKDSLKLDDAVHKAKIEINEEGSTAAAATVLFSFRSSRPTEPTEFHCNHPFVFLIKDSKDVILFTGIYRGPNL